MAKGLPGFLTHYFLKDRSPFLNLMDLDDEGFQRVVDDFRERRRTDTTYNRIFGSIYRELRSKTENALRGKFLEKGGRIERASPHYFCLGESRWFRGFCDHQEIRIPIDQIDPQFLSLTFPDSVTSMGYLKDFGISHNAMPYHGQVFLLNELGQLIEQYGVPAQEFEGDYRNYHRQQLELYIEAQVWSDEPVHGLLQKVR